MAENDISVGCNHFPGETLNTRGFCTEWETQETNVLEEEKLVCAVISTLLEAELEGLPI